MKDGTVITVFGEKIEILQASESTNYTAVVGLQTSPPGGGPPPHRHLGEDETFWVVEGEFAFFENDEWVPIPPGKAKHSLRGTWHGFRNIGKTDGKMLFITHGAGIDEYFKRIEPLKMPDDMEKIEELNRLYRYEYKK